MKIDKEYIAVDVLRSTLNTEIADVVTTYPDYEESGFSRDALNEIIDNIPKEEVAPVIHAKWKLHNDGRGTCSHCNFTQANVYDYDNYQRYCGVCGAKMDLED